MQVREIGFERIGLKGDAGQFLPRRRHVRIADVVNLQTNKRVGRADANFFQIADGGVGLAEVILGVFHGRALRSAQGFGGFADGQGIVGRLLRLAQKAVK